MWTSVEQVPSVHKDLSQACMPDTVKRLRVKRLLDVYEVVEQIALGVVRASR